MPTQWRIEIRLGTLPQARPIRSLVVEADTEAQALRQAASAIDREDENREGGAEGQLLQDGQEEVFSRAEVTDGAIEHKADT